MREHLVFFVEKPSALRTLAPLLSTRWSCKVYAITTLYLGLFEFRYRRGLGMADFPFIGEPAWKPRRRDLSPVFEIHAGEAQRCDLDPGELLRDASSIWFAADPDASSAVAFHVLMSQYLDENAARASWPTLYLQRAHDECSVSQALDTPGTTDEAWFQSLRNAGLAKRFFDFNYNINAMALFGPALRDLESTTREFTVSKYGLQMLYALRDWPPVTSISTLMLAMQKWPGTGRYPHSSLGSPASRPAILEGLRAAGLVQGVSLSATGRAFLARLHPDCRDLDLPSRIDQWEQEWPVSRTKMERYLRTFFGKQKRFASGCG